MDFTIAGPIVGVLSLVDVVLHAALDAAKVRNRGPSNLTEPEESVPALAMTAVAVSTLLSFVLVLAIPLAWLLSAGAFLLLYLVPIIDAPGFIWVPGLAILCFGIVLHGWSRFVRKDMASSWVMSSGHRLITRGPYGWIRHPSYTSYMLSFVGLFLMMPSVVTIVLLVGIPGYYLVTVPEESMLISQFGDEYREYVAQTGRLFPKFGKRRVQFRPKP